MGKQALLDYLAEFEVLGKITDEAAVTGNYKPGNKAYEKMEKIYDLAQTSDEQEQFYLEILQTTESPNALIICCAHMLRLDIKPRLAKKTLKKIAKNQELDGVFRFSAEMFLEEWKKGNIKRESQYKNMKV